MKLILKIAVGVALGIILYQLTNVLLWMWIIETAN